MIQKTEELPLKQSNQTKKGVVTKVFGLYYTVEYDNKPVNCFLKGNLKKTKNNTNFTNPVAVGDNVIINILEDGGGVINEVCERDNYFTRKEKGRNSREDIIAANIDRVVIIQSFIDPIMNLRFVDRITARAKKSNIESLLVINKNDLAQIDQIEYLNDYYSNSGLEYIIVSAANGYNIEKVEKIIKGKRNLLIGYSGVGKTSIVNSIFPDLNLKTAEISDSTGKGRHTTTNVIMYKEKNSTEIIDTPGMREFGIVDIEPHMLDSYFYEFSTHLKDCNFKTCTHEHEPKCRIKEMVENGEIYYGRYQSYLNILESIK